jgi:hypothetical protein
MATGDELDATEIPAAHSFELYFCGHCPSGHLVFLDRANRAILSATLTAGQARKLATIIAERDPNFREVE